MTITAAAALAGTLTPESDTGSDHDSAKSIAAIVSALPEVTTPPATHDSGKAMGGATVTVTIEHPIPAPAKTLVAFNGSVLENYPNFRANCQKHLDMLVEASGSAKGMLELEPAMESSLLGAAVAVACVK